MESEDRDKEWKNIGITDKKLAAWMFSWYYGKKKSGVKNDGN